jgi:general secretion pathway protein D
MTMVSLFPSWRGLSFLALLLFVEGGLPSPAQNAAPGSNFVPASNGTPGANATPAANGAPANFSSYQNMPVNSILDTYEQFSGKHLIRDANLSSIQPISINETGLSKDEMLKLVEATLLLNGVAIVPVDDQTVKIVVVGTKNPRSEGVRIYANAADLPIEDEVVSYYMPLNYVSPQEAQGIFSQSAPFHTTYGAYVPAPSAQAIILTENTSVIRQLIALKELIDVPPARVVSEFVQLNRADAEKVADLLNKLLDTKTNTAGTPATAPGGAPVVPANVGNSAPVSNEHNLISGSAQIVPDTRSNRLLIVTRPVNLPFLKQLISELDQPDIFMVPQRRALKYVLAQDILPALEAALAQGKEEEDEVKKAATPNGPGSNGTNTQQQTTSSNNSSGLSTAGSGSVSAITPQLQAPQENNVPMVVTIGKTRLLADNRSNSIIVFGSPDVSTRVFDMIDQLDRKPLQVYLATVIGELTVSEGMEFGIDILQKFQKVGQGGIGSSLVTPATTTAGSAAVPEPSALTSALGFPLPTGLTLYGAIGSTLNAYVRALESTDRFKVISRPSVYTTNNKLAVIASGSQVPVPSNITSGFTTSSTDLTTTASVQYENVLLQLDIIPLINANHEVTLKIRQTNNSLGSNNIISGNDVPTILTQEINTEVTVPDKSTVVIGGLISDTTKRTTSGLPWLSDIPLLGYLFKDTSKSKERDELIIMIQPTVVETDADQIEVNEAEKERTILGREAVEATSKVSSSQSQNPQPQVISNGTVTHISGYNSKTGAAVIVTPENSPTPATPTGPLSGEGVVPANSSAAPDVSNGKLPKDAPAKTPSN